MITLCIMLCIGILAGIIRILWGILAVTGKITFAILAPIFVAVIGVILIAKFCFELLLPVLIVLAIIVLIKNIFNKDCGI